MDEYVNEVLVCNIFFRKLCVMTRLRFEKFKNQHSISNLVRIYHLLLHLITFEYNGL